MFDKYKESLGSLACEELILSLVQKVRQEEDVFLICYEKEVFDCHRSILAQYMSDKYAIPWKEYR